MVQIPCALFIRLKKFRFSSSSSWMRLFRVFSRRNTRPLLGMMLFTGNSLSNGIIRCGISIALLSLTSSTLFGRPLVFSVPNAVVLDSGVLEVVDIEVGTRGVGSSVVVSTSDIDVTGMLTSILTEVVNSLSFTPFTVVDCNIALLSTSGAPLLPSNSLNWTVVLLSSNSLNWTVVLGMRVPLFKSLKMTGKTVLTGNSVLFSTSSAGADVILVAAETVLTGNSVTFTMSFPGEDVILLGVLMAKDVLCSGVACL